jgi:hypothetical protein
MSIETFQATASPTTHGKFEENSYDPVDAGNYSKLNP